MSPSQRKKGKKTFTVWVSPEEREILIRAAESRGMNLADFFKSLVFEEAKRIGLSKKGENNDNKN